MSGGISSWSAHIRSIGYAEDVAAFLQPHEVLQVLHEAGKCLRHAVLLHLFADGMQSYCSGRLGDVPAIVSRLDSCIADIYVCCAKRLQLNADKTELLWFGPASQLRQLPSHSSTVHVNHCVVKPVTVILVPLPT